MYARTDMACQHFAWRRSVETRAHFCHTSAVHVVGVVASCQSAVGGHIMLNGGVAAVSETVFPQQPAERPFVHRNTCTAGCCWVVGMGSDRCMLAGPCSHGIVLAQAGCPAAVGSCSVL